MDADTKAMIIGGIAGLAMLILCLYLYSWKLNPYEPNCCTELRQRIEALEKR